MSGPHHPRFDGPIRRRVPPRVRTYVEVDYGSEGTFLFVSLGDAIASAPLGIFVRTEDPLPQGTQLQLHFAASAAKAGGVALELLGEVVWTTRDAERTGMGVRFLGIDPSDHVRLLELVRTIAYVDALGAN